MKIQLSIFFFLLTAVIANAQFTCGAIHKPVNTDVTQETVAIDRFNNAYSKKDLASFKEKASSAIQTGYFNLYMSDDLKNIPTSNHPNQGDDFSTVIEQVFSDVSALINQRSHTISCGDQLEQQMVNIIIGTDVCSGVEDCENATSLAAGVGSSFYEQFFLLSGVEENCQFVSESNVWLKINGQKELLPFLFDGLVYINIENPTISYGLDLSNPPASDKIDLYSVVMHEVLHVMGFSSRIDESGSAKEENGFNTRFYSRYDQLLHVADNYQENGQSENVNKLLTSAAGINCHQLTESVTDFTQLLSGNCQNNEKVIVMGPNAMAPISGGVNVTVANALSHLSESCQGSNEDFVMDASIQLGDDEREVTDSEKQILCALGYDVEGLECDACFVHPGFLNFSASFNELSIPYYNSCCEEPFFTEINTPLQFSKEDILCNAVYENDEDITISDIYIAYQSDANGVLVELADDMYEFTGYKAGIFVIMFSVSNCTSYSSTSVLQINVHEIKEECAIDFPCDNLVCNFDYEEYAATNYINYQTGFDNLFIFENAFQNSVDICLTGSNKVSSLVNVDHPEGQLIPLLHPLKPGCTISISVDLADREGSTGLFNISGSEFKPCLPTESLVSVNCNDFGSNSVSNTCGEEVYIPYCLVSGEAVTNSQAGTSIAICPAANLVLETYSWEIEHTGDTDINFLVLHNTASSSVIWVDNVIVTQDCPPEITVQALDFDAKVNETNITEIEVCFGDPKNFQFEGTSVELSILDQPSINILDEGDFNDGIAIIENLDANSCKTVILHYVPTQVGTFDIVMNIFVATLCKDEQHIFEMNVSEVMAISLQKLERIPEGSEIHYYNHLGMELGCYSISTKEEVKNLYKPMITSVYAFTINSEGRIIVADKVYLYSD